MFAPLEASDGHGAAHATALEAKGLSKSFGSVRVIEDVSLQLRLGKVHGLIGPNGSGKTTLLNMITGYVAPDQGTITANTTELSGKSASWIGASGIRRSFQIPQLIGELTVHDNIRLGALGPGRATLTGALLGPYLLPGLRRQGKGEERGLDTIAASLALGPEVMDRAASEVPLGLRRIVEIGRAIMGNPVVICLDEPAAGLGPEDLVVLRSILESLATGGHSLLLIEHNLQFVGQVCDTVFQLEDGVLVSQSDYRPVRSASGRAASSARRASRRHDEHPDQRQLAQPGRSRRTRDGRGGARRQSGTGRPVSRARRRLGLVRPGPSPVGRLDHCGLRPVRRDRGTERRREVDDVAGDLAPAHPGRRRPRALRRRHHGVAARRGGSSGTEHDARRRRDLRGPQRRGPPGAGGAVGRTAPTVERRRRSVGVVPHVAGDAATRRVGS